MDINVMDTAQEEEKMMRQPYRVKLKELTLSNSCVTANHCPPCSAGNSNAIQVPDTMMVLLYLSQYLEISVSICKTETGQDINHTLAL